MAEKYTPQKVRSIDIAKEREKIIKALEATKDKGLLGGLKWFVLLYDPDDTYSNLKEAPIASWEMSMPFGRKLTRKEFDEYMDINEDDDEERSTMDEVKAHLKLHTAERKKFWDEV
jgi:hypothetical protein